MRALVPIIVLLALLAPVSRATAQMLRGQVIDSVGTPVGDVLATLLDSSGATVRSVRSDEAGIVHLVAPRAGTYRATFARIGFTPYTTGKLLLRDGETLIIQIKLTAHPQAVATMIVMARTRREWGRDGWAQRKTLGKGVFLTGDDIRGEKAQSVAEALRVVDGFVVRYRPLPELETLRGNRCLQFMVNSLPMPNIPDEHPSETLDRIMGAERVMGIEVYREYNEVPPVFRSRAVQVLPTDDRSSPIPRRRGSVMTPDTPPTRNCGLINIWTRRAW